MDLIHGWEVAYKAYEDRQRAKLIEKCKEEGKLVPEPEQMKIQHPIVKFVSLVRDSGMGKRKHNDYAMDFSGTYTSENLQKIICIRHDTSSLLSFGGSRISCSGINFLSGCEQLD